MNLSEHFTLEEMISSQTAAREGIDNTPSSQIIANLRVTCDQLELIRILLGKPIVISSGYRSIALNAAIGGVSTSAHCFGFAADILCPGFGSPYEVCQKIEAEPTLFDQLIYEYASWTHISFDPRMRREVLSIKHGGNYEPGLIL